MKQKPVHSTIIAFMKLLPFSFMNHVLLANLTFEETLYSYLKFLKKMLAISRLLSYNLNRYFLSQMKNIHGNISLEQEEAIALKVAVASNRKTIVSQKRPTLQKGMLFSKSISIQAQRKEISRVRRCRV